MRRNMKVKVVRIGNSKGVRIPKELLVQYRIGETVELRVEEGAITLQPSPSDHVPWPRSLKKGGKNKLAGHPPPHFPSWKKGEAPLSVPGVSLSRMIAEERRRS